jgi:F420-dependent oxidoreductase-like protein
MRLSVNIDMTRGVAGLASYVRDLDAAGVDMLWAAEAYGREATSVLAYCAAQTDRLAFGTAALNVFSRSPSQLAQSAATLDELTGGRFELGIGSSGPQVVEGWHGVPFRRPLTRVEEVLDVCRAVWRREEPLTYEGRTVTVPLRGEGTTGQAKALKMLHRPLRPVIPVWLAAIGPKAVEMTARKADGWLAIMLVPERADRVWSEPLKRGGAERDPALAPLRVCTGAHVVVTGEDPDEVRAARDQARPSLARYIGGMGSRETNFYNDLVRRYGFEQDAEQVQDLYLRHEVEAAAAALSDELVEALTVCGPAPYVRDRMQAFADIGVTDFRVAANAGADGVEAVARLREAL